MRQLTGATRLRQFMRQLGLRARVSGRGCPGASIWWAAPAPCYSSGARRQSTSTWTSIRRSNFHHYDFYAQALSKIERGHDRDALDVQAMATQGLIEPARLLGYFEQIVPELYRYPALDPPSFRRAVEETAVRLRTR